MRKIYLFLLCICFGFQLWASDNEKPNVVFILIDDLSHYGVSAYGSDAVISLNGRFGATKTGTPRIDELAEGGIMCENAFAYPLCEATRIALMSGQYNSRNFLKCKSQHASDITFGDTFKKEGYTTGIFGKWKQTRGTKEIRGKEYIFEFGWDEFCCFDVITEGKRFINPNLIVNGEVQDYQMRTDRDPKTGRRWYGPDIVNSKALDFIEKNKDKPFFLYYPMLLVHDEHQPTPDTRPKSVYDNFDEGRNAHNKKKGDDHIFFPDMIQYMDKLIGKVVDKLDACGVRENTLIVVMGDNGTKECFGHVLPNDSIYPGRKGGTADNGLHVPLVFNMPGKVKKGKGEIRRYKGLVDVVDIYPTIAEAVDVDIANKENLDGRSFWPQVLGKKGEERHEVYTWYNNNQLYTNHEELLIYAFDKEFKRYAPCTEYPEGRFFDLRTDPLELCGDRVAERRFALKLWSGLDVSNLSKDQQKAYDRLGKVIEHYQYTAVKKLQIDAPSSCRVGEILSLGAKVYPVNATRKNTIWESSNPEVASINKFGELTANKAGSVTIRLYTWDDAFPVSCNLNETYKRDGVNAKVEILVKR